MMQNNDHDQTITMTYSLNVVLFISCISFLSLHRRYDAWSFVQFPYLRLGRLLNLLQSLL